MNENLWKKDYMGRRDPKEIREERALKTYHQSLERMKKPEQPNVKPNIPTHQEELKRHQENLDALKRNPFSRNPFQR